MNGRTGHGRGLVDTTGTRCANNDDPEGEAGETLVLGFLEKATTGVEPVYTALQAAA